MGGVAQSTFTTILSVEFIMGFLGNGFIALVNCMDWVKRRKMSSVDRILTALAISRIGFIWVVLLDWWVSVLFPTLWMTGKMMRIIYISWTVTNHFCHWLATSLSIFYFLKIANFSNSIFFYLKFRVQKVVLVTMMVSLVVLFWNIVAINTYMDMRMDGCKRNTSYSNSSSNYAQLSKLFSFTNPMFMFIPFSVSGTTFLLLIFSLLRHLKKMQHNANGSRDASSLAHIKALQTVTASLLLYTIFFLSLFIKVWSSEVQQRYLIHLFVRNVGVAFPSGHSFVLILGTSKLRRASVLVLWWLRCRCKSV
ncbi:taste receptor type 2 member 113-like [Castor canadensis]|uniref:Taste receptor type 2 n=1 Tax=Castor canadensis TaxID=51338 RepID=A0A8B7TJ38_CASCN|nr:taste receptor type 2 member 113-like [Castor canadensis]